MHWNHRVLRTETDGEVNYAVHEVYYGDVDVPDSKQISGWTESAIEISGESIAGLHWQLDRIKRCLDLPVLCVDDSGKLVEFKE